MTGPREAAYDEHIAPLMTRIIALCKEHKIPIVASFEMTGPDDEDGVLCTTFVDGPDWKAPAKFDEARRAIMRGPTFVAMTITSAPKGGAT